MQETFIMYTEFAEQYEMLSDRQAGALTKAIFRYLSGGELPKMDGVTRMAFTFIRAAIDRSGAAYRRRVESNRENGRKGGRPRQAGEEALPGEEAAAAETLPGCGAQMQESAAEALPGEAFPCGPKAAAPMPEQAGAQEWPAAAPAEKTPGAAPEAKLPGGTAEIKFQVGASAAQMQSNAPAEKLQQNAFAAAGAALPCPGAGQAGSPLPLRAPLSAKQPSAGHDTPAKAAQGAQKTQMHQNKTQKTQPKTQKPMGFLQNPPEPKCEREPERERKPVFSVCGERARGAAKAAGLYSGNAGFSACKPAGGADLRSGNAGLSAYKPAGGAAAGADTSLKNFISRWGMNTHALGSYPAGKLAAVDWEGISAEVERSTFLQQQKSVGFYLRHAGRILDGEFADFTPARARAAVSCAEYADDPAAACGLF